MTKKDNLSLVLCGPNDLKLKQTPLPGEPQPNGKSVVIKFSIINYF